MRDATKIIHCPARYCTVCLNGTQSGQFYGRCLRRESEVLATKFPLIEGKLLMSWNWVLENCSLKWIYLIYFNYIIKKYFYGFPQSCESVLENYSLYNVPEYVLCIMHYDLLIIMWGRIGNVAEPLAGSLRANKFIQICEICMQKFVCLTHWWCNCIPGDHFVVLVRAFLLFSGRGGCVVFMGESPTWFYLDGPRAYSPHRGFLCIIFKSTKMFIFLLPKNQDLFSTFFFSNFHASFCPCFQLLFLLISSLRIAGNSKKHNTIYVQIINIQSAGLERILRLIALH